MLNKMYFNMKKTTVSEHQRNVLALHLDFDFGETSNLSY